MTMQSVKMEKLADGPETRRAKLLIVDDEPINLSMLSELLKPFYSVHAASSGIDALRIAAREPSPDLILLDILMPEMDGFEVLRWLRDDPRTRDIPVIFLSVMKDEDDEQRGFELGAVDYIHKPIKSVVVLSRVRAQLDAKVARDMLRLTNQLLTQRVVEGVNALEQAQQQLVQSEKMAAMGQLAAGIAHEISNPITFVDMNLAAIKNYLDDVFAVLDGYERAENGPPAALEEVRTFKKTVGFDNLLVELKIALQDSKEGTERVAKIVRDLKDFSRAGDKAWQFADLHAGLDSTLKIIWNELKFKCTITKNYGDIPRVRCLPSQLNQVFMNLLMNASHAIANRGDIVISTQRLGDHAVQIVISDSGSGMSPEVLAHIFEPFFTTKPVGQGTGLGLPISQGIVAKHGGKLEVVSELGKGTSFTITLPIDPVESAATDGHASGPS
ncbi:MAG: ATP-binding protein [Myxococcales bacterium]